MAAIVDATGEPIGAQKVSYPALPLRTDSRSRDLHVDLHAELGDARRLVIAASDVVEESIMDGQLHRRICHYTLRAPIQADLESRSRLLTLLHGQYS